MKKVIEKFETFMKFQQKYNDPKNFILDHLHHEISCLSIKQDQISEGMITKNELLMSLRNL